VKDKTLAAAVPQVTSAPVTNVVQQATSVVSVPVNIHLPALLPARLPTAPSL
jgi:hypothetical protein